MGLTLYHNEMSTCAQKVRTALAEKGLSWQSEHLKLRQGEQFDPAYLKLNPKGVVPTLVHDVTVVRESQVILEYLDDAFPDPPLRPAEPAARAQMRLWNKQMDEDVHQSVGVLSMTMAFRHQFLAMSPDQLEAYFATLPDPGRRGVIEGVMKLGTHVPPFERALRRFQQLFREMEATLEQSEWLAGDTYSLADVSYTPYLTRLDHLALLDPLEAGPRLRAWYAKVQSRPSYDTAFREWENPEYFEIYATKSREELPRVRELLAG